MLPIESWVYSVGGSLKKNMIYIGNIIHMTVFGLILFLHESFFQEYALRVYHFHNACDLHFKNNLTNLMMTLVYWFL
jgi:hypothetical protein